MCPQLSAPVPDESYVWHPCYVDALAIRYDNTSGTVEEQYATHDANFNVTALYDNTGSLIERYHYTPYGDVEIRDANFALIGGPGIGNPYTYTGRRFDSETGLYYYRARNYHSQLGRFISRDPISYAAGDPNLYQYVSSSPAIGLDPSGLQNLSGSWYIDHEFAFLGDRIGEFLFGGRGRRNPNQDHVGYQHQFEPGKFGGFYFGVADALFFGLLPDEQYPAEYSTYGKYTGMVAVEATTAGLVAASLVGKTKCLVSASSRAPKTGAGHYTDFADEAADIMENAARSRGLTPNANVVNMALSRKDALKRLEGLSPQVRDHIEKLAKSPTSRDAPHWRGEIKTWLEQMESVTGSTGKKTSAEWLELIKKWRQQAGIE